MPLKPLTISGANRDWSAWARCEEIAWPRPSDDNPIDRFGERDSQYGIPLADRIMEFNRQAECVFRFILRHPGCRPRDIPTINVRVGNLLERLVDRGLVRRVYTSPSRFKLYAAANVAAGG